MSLSVKSLANNEFLLLVVDMTTVFLLLSRLPSKQAGDVARQLLHLSLTFGLRKTIHADGGREFTVEDIQAFCRLFQANV